MSSPLREFVEEAPRRTPVRARAASGSSAGFPGSSSSGFSGGGWAFELLSAPHDLPYRMMLPRGVEGLLVAGRSASADHVAQSSIRKTTTCMTMGQAAGTAAALAVRRKVTPRQVPIGDLQVTLRAQGAILSADEAVEYA